MILYLFALYTLVVSKHLDATLKSELEILDQYIENPDSESYNLWAAKRDY